MTTQTKTDANKQVQIEINKRKELFEKASKVEKRVLIASDVIKQIQSGLFIPENGTFVRFGDELAECDPEQSVQVEFLKQKEPCECCALGGMMLSCTLFNNKETFASSDNNFCDLGYVLFDTTAVNTIKNEFDKIFSLKQLGLIENAFEQGGGFFNTNTPLDRYKGKFTRKEIQEAVRFGKLYEDEKCRLIAIMKNIVDHGGIFDPNDENWIKYNTENLISKYF